MVCLRLLSDKRRENLDQIPEEFGFLADGIHPEAKTGDVQGNRFHEFRAR
jgi:hypothetical protein